MVLLAAAAVLLLAAAVVLVAVVVAVAVMVAFILSRTSPLSERTCGLTLSPTCPARAPLSCFNRSSNSVSKSKS
jgi:hypothetical protein